MYVANLSNKGMIIDMIFLKYHNPEIDWAREELHFTRCPKICALKGCRKNNIPYQIRNSMISLNLMTKIIRLKPLTSKKSQTN